MQYLGSVSIDPRYPDQLPAQELPSRACAKCVWRVTVSTVQPQESYPEEGREGEDPHRKKNKLLWTFVLIYNIFISFGSFVIISFLFFIMIVNAGANANANKKHETRSKIENFENFENSNNCTARGGFEPGSIKM